MTWADAVTAVATAVIALLLTVLGMAWLVWLKEVRGLMRAVERLVDAAARDAGPALQSARRLVEDASGAVAAMRAEVGGFAKTSRDVRERLERLTQALDDRLRDLDALVDIVQDELEETALDVAAALRATRRGSSVVRAMKRAFLGRRR